MASSQSLPWTGSVSFDRDLAAIAALTAAEAAPALVCDACDQPIVGEPGGEGVYLWTRGEEIRLEPAPLCDRCAIAIGISALGLAEIEEEDS